MVEEAKGVDEEEDTGKFKQVTTGLYEQRQLLSRGKYFLPNDVYSPLHMRRTSLKYMA